MKTFVCAAATAFVSVQAFAQTPASGLTPTAQAQDAREAAAGLTTPIGHHLNVSLGGYEYGEPGETSISIHGFKIGGEYTGTLPINRNRHWFAQADLRATSGHTTYDGWCSPFFITPDSASPNGYFLDLGDPSPCSESGDSDWYVETRGLVGKDLVGRRWAWSPFSGLGFRHLSNGIAGVSGYRTEKYLYLPLGVTARTRVASQGTLGFTLEYDYLIHGWQTTYGTKLGGGIVPATPTAPAFTIEGFTDVSFDQQSGWAVRASSTYRVTRRWSVEPYYVYWNVDASPVSRQIVAFTVNGITVQEQFGAYEPDNFTHEFGVKLGFHF
jgi:hypothetical protein